MEGYISISEYDRLKRESDEKDALIQFMDERYKYFAEILPIGVRIIDNDFNVIYCNSALETITGISNDEAVGKKCWESFPSPYCHSDWCHLRQIKFGEKQISNERERTLKDGSVKMCRTNSFPFYDRDGKQAGIIETFQDISHETVLEPYIDPKLSINGDDSTTVETLISIINGTGEAIAIIKQVDQIHLKAIFVNNSFSKITGIEEDSLSDASFMSIISERFQSQFMEKIDLAIRHPQIIYTIKTALVTPKAFEFHVKMRLSRIKFAGEDAILIRLHETSHVKEPAQKTLSKDNDYNFLFKNSPIPTSELDFSERKAFIQELRDKGIEDIPEYLVNNIDEYRRLLAGYNHIAYNNAILKLHDAETADDIKGYSLSGRTSSTVKRDPEHQKDYIRQIISIVDGVIPPPHQSTINTLKGNTKHIISYFFISPDDIERKHIIWYAIDITERVEAERKLQEYLMRQDEIIASRTQELSEALEKVEQNSIQQTKFIQHLVHDLKTPLMPMLGASEMLMEKTDDPVLLRIANNIHRGTVRLKNNINDLLDLMRGEKGILKLNTSPASIASILMEAADFFSFELDRNGQELILDIDDDLPMIEIDRERIRQVISNLLENAVRFTSSGGTIKMHASCNGNSVCIMIEDNGIGFRETDPNKLFEPYYSTEYVQGSLSGLGLGLPLAKIVVGLHRGTISAENVSPHGALFKITLPVR